MRRSHVLSLGLVLLVPSAALAQAPADRAATIKYLQSLRAPGGGYYAAAPAPGSQPEPSVGATSSALRAIKYFGGEAKDTDADARFVARCFDPSTGGFADRPGEKPTVRTTAVGAMAVAELKMPLDQYRSGVLRYLGANAKGFEELRIAAAAVEALGARPPEAEAWLKEVLAQRKVDGTFGAGDGAARATGSAVALILRLGGTIEHRDAVLRVMKAGQRTDGGYGPADKPGSDLESTYRVMRSLMMLKERPNDVVKLRAFIASCRNKDGGYGVTPSQPSTVSGTYFAGIIQHWLDAR